MRSRPAARPTASAAGRKADFAVALTALVEAAEGAIPTLVRSPSSPPPDTPGRQLSDAAGPDAVSRRPAIALVPDTGVSGTGPIQRVHRGAIVMSPRVEVALILGRNSEVAPLRVGSRRRCAGFPRRRQSYASGLQSDIIRAVKRALTLIVAAVVAASLAVVLAGWPAAAARHPSLSLVKRVPVEVRGTGFGPREMVRVSSGWAQMGVRSSARGSFAASLPVSARCSGRRVLAVGSGGQRAVLRIPPMLCPPS
jgi:hypothetical protein